jgi:hypothetical protein
MAAFMDSSAIEAIFAQPLPDGSFEKPIREYLRSAGARRPLLVLAFAPKSAGTYFRQAAIHAIDGRLIRMCHAQGGRDGTLYLPNVLACCLDDAAPATVTHIHMQALAGNRHFIEALRLKPVIMLRNLADMLASFLDMLEVDPVARAEGLNCQIPRNFCELERSAKLDFMIDVIAPWYASYFATWKSFVDDAPATVCVLHYSDFCDNPAEALYQAIIHAGFATTRFQCLKSVERVWEGKENYRYNKGIPGRSKDYFTPAQFARLQKLLSYYPQLSSWIPELLGKSGTSVPVLDDTASPDTRRDCRLMGRG